MDAEPDAFPWRVGRVDADAAVGAADGADDGADAGFGFGVGAGVGVEAGASNSNVATMTPPDSRVRSCARQPATAMLRASRV